MISCTMLDRRVRERLCYIIAFTKNARELLIVELDCCEEYELTPTNFHNNNHDKLMKLNNTTKSGDCNSCMDNSYIVHES